MSSGAAVYTPFIVPKGRTWTVTGLFTSNIFNNYAGTLDPKIIPYEVRKNIPMGEAPDRSRPEFLVLRFEVKVVYTPGKVLRCFKFALDEGFVDDHFHGDVRQFASLPVFHLLSRGLEVPLHSIDANRNAIDERERLRVFREHRCKRAGDNVSKLGKRDDAMVAAEFDLRTQRMITQP